MPSDAIEREIRKYAGERRPEVWVVSPAVVETPFRHAAGDVDEGIEEATRRLEETLAEARSTDAEVVGAAVGDSDPILAIEDALRTAPADEVLIVTHDEEESRWLEEGLFDRARQKLEPPLSHVVVREGDSRVVERAEAGADSAEGVEFQSRTNRDFSYSARDLAGIAVAVAGSVTLLLLAASCADGDFDRVGFTHCSAELLIAGIVTLINLAHIVGLVLFSAVGYRGPWERFFARFSLIGTPAAIVAVIGISLVFG